MVKQLHYLGAVVLCVVLPTTAGADLLRVVCTDQAVISSNLPTNWDASDFPASRTLDVLIDLEGKTIDLKPQILNMGITRVATVSETRISNVAKDSDGTCSFLSYTLDRLQGTLTEVVYDSPNCKAVRIHRFQCEKRPIPPKKF